MKELKHQDLVQIYKEGEQADSSLYAEMRSNVQLVSGNHYNRKGSRFWGRIRDDRGLSEDQKIRLTKNHIQKICKIYEGNILGFTPGVHVEPKNSSELQDQKTAELNQSVWVDFKQKQKMREKIRAFCQDFVRIGEVGAKIFWDETKGEFLGYEQGVDEYGQPMADEYGRPIADKKKPKFSGDFVIERLFGFNVFRAKEAKSFSESWFIGTRKMVDLNDLKARIGDDQEKLKFLEESKDETYVVFDASGSSTESKGQCLLLEMYIKPCITYPKGYFYIYTMKGVLWEGELPFGVFPIAYEGFDEVPTQPRFHSIIKVIRPYQAEINRASSKVAEHQITLSDDKILVQAGTKLSQGGTLPGVRALQYAGNPPTILPGRAGDQYFAYIDRQIAEMYQVANVEEEMAEKQDGTQDPYTMLFKSMGQKKKYAAYASKFECFLANVCEIVLKLAKEYYTPDMLIPVIGRSEFVNISEFKTSNPLNYSVVVEPGGEDLESRLGKQLTFNQILQYVGSNLQPDQIGKLIKSAPYLSKDNSFDDMTIDADNATNMILALDRGKPLPVNQYDDPKYMSKRLASRMRKADFQFLDPQIQMMYQQTLSQYEEVETQQMMKIKAAQSEFIPQSGMAVVCDIYVPDPNNTSKTMRARIPYDSLVWLMKRLEEQGMSQDAIMQQQQGVIADVAEKFMSQSPTAQAYGQGQSVQPEINPQ